MPKNSAKSVVRQKPRSKGQKKTNSKELREITYEEIPQTSKRKYILATIALILILAGFFVLKSKSPLKTSNTTASSPSSPQSTQEAKLKEVYEKRVGTPLGNDFSPRFSVFEDSQLGFKIAYPVGFVATSIGNGVLIRPEQGGGTISVTVNNGSFDVKVDKSGLDAKQADILDTASVFVRDSFQSTNAGSGKQSKDRFSGGQGKDKY